MPTIISHAATSIPISLGLKNKSKARKLIFLSIIFFFLPDLDGTGYQLGIKYNSLFGHRGFSRSVFFIIIAAAPFVYLASPKTRLRSKNFYFFS